MSVTVLSCCFLIRINFQFSKIKIRINLKYSKCCILYVCRDMFIFIQVSACKSLSEFKIVRLNDLKFVKMHIITVIPNLTGVKS